MDENRGFTIVELLVVITVIGLLAAITIISYTLITRRAVSASLQSDLDNTSKQLKMYQVDNASFPTELDENKCPQTPVSDTGKCMKPSGGNSFNSYSANSQFFYLFEQNGTICYDVTNNSTPSENISCNPLYVTIGSKIWMTTSQNVGTMIASSQAQQSGSTLEKWCIGDNPDNCAAYGAHYQWGEAMQYSTSEEAQGICPSGFHIPSDTEWSALDTFLSPNVATKLKTGGETRFNGLLSGYLYAGTANWVDSKAHYWTSTQVDPSIAWERYYTTGPDLTKISGDKLIGYSVRCVSN